MLAGDNGWPSVTGAAGPVTTPLPTGEPNSPETPPAVGSGKPSGVGLILPALYASASSRWMRKTSSEISTSGRRTWVLPVRSTREPALFPGERQHQTSPCMWWFSAWASFIAPTGSSSSGGMWAVSDLERHGIGPPAVSGLGIERALRQEEDRKLRLAGRVLEGGEPIVRRDHGKAVDDGPDLRGEGGHGGLRYRAFGIGSALRREVDHRS